MPQDNLKIRVMLPADQQRVTKFYIDNFYRYEPVFSSEPKLMPGPRDLADIAECIQGGTSVMCYRESHQQGEEMLGGLLAMAKDRSYVDHLLDAAASEGNTKYAHYLKMLGVIHRQADVCNRYGVNKIFFSFMASVEPSGRGQNICKRLAAASMALADHLGFKVYTADCTSNYTARICELMRMDRLNTLMYKDFVDGNKKPYFVVPGLHEAVRTYAIRLPWAFTANIDFLTSKM